MDFLSNKEIFLGIFIVAIILINVSLFSALRKNKSGSTMQILKISFTTVKNPFKKENEQMEELSHLINQLQDKNTNKSNNEEN
jgi:hypothetical protein